MAVEWTQDFCLTCDHEVPAGAAYCSQQCRLVDLEQASCASTNSSPKSAASYAPPTVSYGFTLPPPLNSSNLTSQRKSIPSLSSLPSTTPPGSLSYSTTSARQRTSLPSLYHDHSNSRPIVPFRAQQDSGHLSESALRELKDYANAFDQVRDWKRRVTLV